MLKVNYDKRKFSVDAYGNLIPKFKQKGITHAQFKRLRKSPQPHGVRTPN
jgi:hypothetical protein